MYSITTRNPRAVALGAALVGPLMFGWADAQALTLTVYTNRTTFLGALTSATHENFTGQSGIYTTNFGSIDLNGFNLSTVVNGDRAGFSNSTIATSSGFPYDDYAIPSAFNGQTFYGWGNVNGNTGPTTTLTFDGAGTQAFGFDWFNTDFSDSFRVTLNPGGASYVAPPFGVAGSAAASGFWGVIASGGLLTSAVIATNQFGGYVSTGGFDNVITSYGVPTAPVPVPAAVWLLGSASLGLLGRVRRR